MRIPFEKRKKARLGAFVLNFAVFVISVLIANRIARRMEPISPQLWDRFEDFRANQDSVNAVFIGSSYTLNGIRPQVVDSTLDLHSFNLSAAGYCRRDVEFVVDRVLRHPAPALRFVFVEIGPEGNIGSNERYRNRVMARGVAIRRISIPNANTPSSMLPHVQGGITAEVFRGPMARNARRKYLRFLKEWEEMGRPSPPDPDQLEDASTKISAGNKRIYRAYSALAKRIEAAGIQPVFYFPPKLEGSRSKDISNYPEPRIDFNNPPEFRQLWRPDRFWIRDHLAEEGALIWSAAFAEAIEKKISEIRDSDPAPIPPAVDSPPTH